MNKEEFELFFKDNLRDLVFLYSDERKKKDYGVLFIYCKMDYTIQIYYLEMNQIPDEIKQDIIQKYKEYKSNLNNMFFCFYNDMEKSNIFMYNPYS